LAATAESLASRLASVSISDPADSGRLQNLRRDYLIKQIQAARARLRMVEGKKLSFDEQARLIYDTTFSPRPDAYYQALAAKLEAMIPGSGPLRERVEHYENQFTIPRDKIDLVMRAAIAECRQRTR